jgi:hypothetical protein
MKTPDKIIEALEALPPFQRKKISESYIGQIVEWRVTFRNIFNLSGNKVSLFLHNEEDEIIPLIYCDTDLEKYPQFKLMKEQEKFSIRGQIKCVEGHSIELENCEYAFEGNDSFPSEKISEINSVAPVQNFHINESPGASIIHASNVRGNSGGNLAKSDSPMRQIVIGIVIVIVGGAILFYFNLNGNKGDLSFHPSSNTKLIISNSFGTSCHLVT